MSTAAPQAMSAPNQAMASGGWDDDVKQTDRVEIEGMFVSLCNLISMPFVNTNSED